jgi:uncharacterized membrane protein
LIGSLSLNAFVAAWLLAGALHWSGMIGDHHSWRHGHDMRWAAEQGDGRGFMRPRGMMHDLMRDEAADGQFGGLMDQHRAGLRAAFVDARSARRALHDLMDRAEETGQIDKPALADALTRVRQSTQSVQAQMHAALLDAAETLSVEEFEELIEHGRHRGDHHEYDDD